MVHCVYPTTTKTRSKIRNVSVTAAAALSRDDAYAMSHLSAVNLATGWLGVLTHALLLRPSNHKLYSTLLITRRRRCPSLKFTMPTYPARGRH